MQGCQPVFTKKIQTLSEKTPDSTFLRHRPISDIVDETAKQQHTSRCLLLQRLWKNAWQSLWATIALANKLKRNGNCFRRKWRDIWLESASTQTGLDLPETQLSEQLSHIYGAQRPLVAWWRHFLQSTVERPFCKFNILFAHLLPVCARQGPFQYPFTSIWLFSFVRKADRTFTVAN